MAFEYPTNAIWVAFFYGAGTMICLHCTVVSFLLYLARRTNMSNILKIIFNFSNMWRFLILFCEFLVPTDPKLLTLGHCKFISYSLIIGNIIFHEALVAFLLWRLKQIESNEKDKWISIVLLVLRSALFVPSLIQQHPEIQDDSGRVFCIPNFTESAVTVFCSLALEFIVEIYVTVRLVQILTKANRNAAQISSNISNKNKRSLFTAVMYWNFLRVAIAFIVNVYALQIIFRNDQVEDVEIPVKTVLNILLSYVITADAEIVRVIEGRNPNKKGINSSSAGTEKSFKSAQSPRTPYLPKYSPPPFTSSSMEYGNTKLTESNNYVVSSKRLSFFEWANFVIGKVRGKGDQSNSDDSHREEQAEVIEASFDTEEYIEDDSYISTERRSSASTSATTDGLDTV